MSHVSNQPVSDRASRLAQLLADVAARRQAGEVVDDAALIAAHSELMPELADQLRVLGLVGQMMQRAQTDPADVTIESAAQAETLVSPSGGSTLETPPPQEVLAHGESIPGYDILREIHRGGQGVVYQALQKSTKRKVAIKVMREGPFAGSSDKARFEREVQILGQLQHPNIVGVHDSGSAAGNFYFVMDYIPGQPLDVYMAGAGEHRRPAGDARERGRSARNVDRTEHRMPTPTEQREAGGSKPKSAKSKAPGLSIESTLKLFAKICEAVNAAHLRGIIHRDLKPGNIRVDPSGEPHILDFGLAKVAAFDPIGEAGSPVMTMTGQFIGSLPWASPEQAEGQPSKIDVRTDVYSLGVILYQMLTGKFPYEVIGNMRDVLDRILRAEPAKPSTIRRQINDEVETIVLKCLSKERERRYQTAGELARDIHHYLNGEPIEAKRDSAYYVLRKQLKRHRFSFSIAAVFLVMITAGFVVSLALWKSAARERDRADSERDNARAAESESRRQLEAATAARMAEREARQSAERNNYSANLLAAQLGIQAGEYPEARRRLAACVTELRGWEWGWLTLQCDSSLRQLQNSNSTRSATLSRDSRRIYALGESGEILEWDVSGDAAPQTRPARQDRVTHQEPSITEPTSFAVECDGTRGLRNSYRKVAEGRFEGSRISLINLETGEALAAMDPDEDSKYVDGTFGPNGAHVVLRTRNEIRVCDAMSGKQVGDIERFADQFPRPIAITRKAALVAEVVGSGLRMWSVKTGEQLLSFPTPVVVDVLMFDRAGERLAAADAWGEITIFDAKSGEALSRLSTPVKRQLQSIAFHPNGDYLAAGSKNGTVYLWDLSSQSLQHVMPGHDGPVSRLFFNSDGSRLFSAAPDSIRVWRSAWSARSCQVVPEKTKGEMAARMPTFSEDGSQFFAASVISLHILSWNTATLEPLQERSLGADIMMSGLSVVVRGVSDAAEILALSPNPRRVLVSNRTMDMKKARQGDFQGEESAELFDPVQKQVVARIVESELQLARTAAFSADGRRVAIATFKRSNDQASESQAIVRVCDAQDGRLIRDFGAGPKAPLGQPLQIVLNSGGTQIATTARLPGATAGQLGPETVFYIADVDNGATICVIDRALRQAQKFWIVNSLCFSPDSRSILAACSDGALRLWDARTGREIATMTGHQGQVYHAIFQPGGARLVSAGHDGTLRVWNAGTFDLLLTIREHTSPVGRVAFSPDGTRLLTAAVDGLRLFDARALKDVIKEHENSRASQDQPGVLKQPGAPWP